MARPFVDRTIKYTLVVAAIAVGFLTLYWLTWSGHSLTDLNIGFGNPNLAKIPDRHTSNISREEYETALAKWNSLNVTDYEATVRSSLYGDWKIVVHVDKAYAEGYRDSLQGTYSHDIVRYEGLDREELDKMWAHLYEYTTVGGLFDDVADMLHCQEKSCKDDHWFYGSRYVIEFDSEMGYPAVFKQSNQYSSSETRIEDLRILK